ncbi:MAG TPA: hypothetical protein DHW82_12630 [Spirochaetia bacterium]|nr:MAG: hypothetical protein A2Y41_04100 [Spirochaetes bacterium GWB1_36_13]HCL57835.1 hypothetical protein [Spirochaetia bacterium]
MEDNFTKILSQWEEFMDQGKNLFSEGQKRFIHSAKSYCDSMKYFSEMSGNIPMSSLYQTLSKNIDQLQSESDKR